MRRPFVLVPQVFGSLVFGRRTGRYVAYDAEVTRRLVDAVEHPLPTVPDGPALFRSLERRGYFDLRGRFDAEVIDVVPPADHLTGPLAVHLEVIAACDLSCAHCFAGPLPRRGQLSLEEFDTLFAELAALGSFRLAVTGGEPLLRRDLLDILDAAIGHGLHPQLTTHGLHVDDRWARELGRRPLWLTVSLDGASAATHDRIRGVGTFDRAVASIRRLAEHATFAVAFTITSDLADEVESCVALARDLGATTVVFRPLYPVGTAARSPELMPSFEQYTAAVDRLLADGGVVEEARQPSWVIGGGCGAGTVIASVSSTGEVSPCSFLGPTSTVGHLRRDSFRDIWHHSRGLRDLRAQGCSGCSGGCPARAQALGGPGAPDPWLEAFRRSGGRHPSTNLRVAR